VFESLFRNFFKAHTFIINPSFIDNRSIRRAKGPWQEYTKNKHPVTRISIVFCPLGDSHSPGPNGEFLLNSILKSEKTARANPRCKVFQANSRLLASRHLAAPVKVAVT
jgi:hypothetical protein